MTAKLKLLSAFGICVASGLVAGCQTYDFERVTPLAIAQTTQSQTVIAHQSKPNLMLLVDKSGSMDLPINPGNGACPANCGTGNKSNVCPASCPTRWTELQQAMNSFLANQNPVARMGMTAYPTDATCGASPTEPRIGIPNSADVASELAATASAINAEIQAIKSTCPAGVTGCAGQPNATGGGTPTGPSLKALGDYAGLQDPNREDFILVLTDGLPNCNPTNLNSCQNAAACRCTLAGNVCGGNFCTLGCLDKGGAVAEVAALRSKQIRTIMVGFGAETSNGDGPESLNAMAEAGGFARSCPKGTNAECGSNNSCNQGTKLCDKMFYAAQNASELAAALNAITQILDKNDICKYTLQATPSNPEFLSVLINGVPTPKGAETWNYNGGTEVNFTGKLCEQVQDSKPETAVRVEFRIVEGI